jgi:hypothetical protein
VKFVAVAYEKVSVNVRPTGMVKVGEVNVGEEEPDPPDPLCPNQAPWVGTGTRELVEGVLMVFPVVARAVIPPFPQDHPFQPRPV